MAFSITPNVPMERKTDVWRHFYQPCVPTARSYLFFYVPSERLVGRENNIIPFRSIGTTGELGVLLAVGFMGKLKLLERAGVPQKKRDLF